MKQLNPCMVSPMSHWKRSLVLLMGSSAFFVGCGNNPSVITPQSSTSQTPAVMEQPTVTSTDLIGSPTSTMMEATSSAMMVSTTSVVIEREKDIATSTTGNRITPPTSTRPAPPDAMKKEEPIKPVPAPAAPREVTFDVKGGSFFYEPNTMQVKKGDHVTIRYSNIGGMHDINIEEFGVKSSVIRTGESTSVDFVANKVGSFEYYCSVGQHRQMGQKGTLTVTE